MGVTNAAPQPAKLMAYPSIGEDAVQQIIIDAVTELREWGVKFPSVITHKFDPDPNVHTFSLTKNYFGYIKSIV